MRKINIFLSFLFCLPLFAKGTHIFGGDLLYTYLNGNNYKLTLVLYADCEAKYINSGSSFNALYNGTPILKVFNGTTLTQTTTMTLNTGFPIDVSPVCPAQVGVTVCNNQNNTTPGVFKFQYTANITLPSASANWRFVFTGAYGNGFTGRAQSLTNITSGVGGSIMALEARLNNTLGNNNSPAFNTLPTPFYCINVAQNFNQGAVDPDGDSLVFALVNGIDSLNNSVNYIAPYNAIAPLSATPFLFINANGQMSFTPNQVQNSLVVNRISEYKNGVLVGTSMREMTFVVLGSCTNNPPSGVITAPNTGVVDTGNNINICAGATSLNFNIPASDPNGNNITLSAAGLPSGATLIYNANGTATANASFSWTPPGGFVIGNYTFFLTFQDDGCPLTSKQVIAFTVKVNPGPTLTAGLLQPSCNNGQVGSITATASNGTPTYTYSLNNGTGVNNNTFANLVSGIYTLSVKDSKGCSTSTLVTMNTLPLPVINNINIVEASCSPGCDGSATINTTSPNGVSLSFSINNGATFQPANSFSSLCLGNYTIVAKDANNCSKTSVINVANPNNPNFTNINTVYASCAPGCDGVINNISANNGSNPYSFSLNGGSWQTGNSFPTLCIGNYTVGVRDANLCSKTTVVSIITPPNPLITSLSNTTASCTPGCDATINNITVQSPAAFVFTYSLNNGPFQSSATFNNVCVGTYTIIVKDAFNCSATTSVSIVTPVGPVVTSVQTITASCVPGCDGQITSIIAFSPNGNLTYSSNGINFVNTNFISGLCIGNYVLTVKDGSGCLGTKLFDIIINPPPIIAGIITTESSCIPGCDAQAAISANAFGGISLFYSKVGSTPSPNSTITALCVGIYTLIVADSKGCTATSSIEILKVPDPFWASATGLNVSCSGLSDGIINVDLTGNGGVQYALFPGNISNVTGIWNNLAPGPYNVVGVDSKGCSISLFFSIINPDPLAWGSVTTQQKTCDDVNNGIIAALAGGGTGDITYTLNGGIFNQTGIFITLNSGTYTVVATDINGCTLGTLTTVLPPSNPLKITSTFKDVSCEGVSGDGYAEAFVTSGVGPFNYKWSSIPEQSTAKIVNLTSGIYIVSVQDVFGCVKRDTVELRDPSICCEQLYFPNAISVNGDSTNDNFFPITRTKISDYNLAIYNRWGKKIWETSDLKTAWDGKRKGKDLDTDTYYFLLRYKCAPNNKYYTKKGDIIILK
jgi:gliding motility-associated-like protein